MLLVWAFNHQEARACFSKAIDVWTSCDRPADDRLRLAHWAMAHALSPNYNKPDMSAEELKEARAHSATALRLLETADDSAQSRRFRALVSAQQVRLKQREDDLSGAAFTARDLAYAESMQQLYDMERSVFNGRILIFYARILISVENFLI